MREMRLPVGDLDKGHYKIARMRDSLYIIGNVNKKLCLNVSQCSTECGVSVT